MKSKTKQFLIAQGVIKEDYQGKVPFMRDGEEFSLSELLEEYLEQEDTLSRLKEFLNDVRKSRSFRIILAFLTFGALVSCLIDERAIVFVIVCSFLWVINEIVEFVIQKLNQIKSK